MSRQAVTKAVKKPDFIAELQAAPDASKAQAIGAPPTFK